MCIGDQTLDTIGPKERETLKRAARQALPHHAFQVHANQEGIAWVVFEPCDDCGVRFTMCRIASCMMVMTEAPGRERRIVSTESVDDALAFVRSTAAADASPTLH